MQGLIESYGYPILYLGTFLEGETVLVLAGYAAKRGYLWLPLVIVVAFCGTLTSDQLAFYIGRRKGLPFLERRPHWKRRVERVRAMFDRFEIAVLIGFRFLYGLRNVTPFVIGASGYSPWKFLAWNAIGSALWATIVACLGYAFGHAIEAIIDEIHRYEAWVIGGVLVVGIGLVLLRRRALRRGE